MSDVQAFARGWVASTSKSSARQPASLARATTSSIKRDPIPCPRHCAETKSSSIQPLTPPRSKLSSSAVEGQSLEGVKHQGVEGRLEQLAQELRIKTCSPHAKC